MNQYKFRKEFEYSLESLDNIFQSMLMKLINESDDLWKLLKYNTYNALDEDDLTYNEKAELIEFKPELKVSKQPFKMIPYVGSQALLSEATEIRMYPYNDAFNNDTFVTTTFAIEIITHYNNYLIDGGFRISRMKSQLIKVLNNFNYDDAAGVLNSFTFDNTNSRIVDYGEGFIGERLLLVGDLK